MIILIIRIIWPKFFIDFFMWKMDPMSGFDIRLVFTLPPRDSTMQYKRCVHLWNNFPCIITLFLVHTNVWRVKYYLTLYLKSFMLLYNRAHLCPFKIYTSHSCFSFCKLIIFNCSFSNICKWIQERIFFKGNDAFLILQW